MNYYISTTEYNRGIDYHARQMVACVMDRQGKALLHTNIAGNDWEYFLGYCRLVKGSVASAGKIKGNAILADKLARAVYFMLRKGTAFDAERVIATSI